MARGNWIKYSPNMDLVTENLAENSLRNQLENFHFWKLLKISSSKH